MAGRELYRDLYGTPYIQHIHYNRFWQVAEKELDHRIVKAMKLRWKRNGLPTGLSYREIGMELGDVSGERGRQLVERGLRKMRHPHFRKLFESGACPCCGRTLD